MPFYYRLSKPSELESEITADVVIYCANKLNICPPKVLFIKNTQDKENSVLSYDIDGAGFAEAVSKTIYITLPTNLYRMVHTVAHECWHIYEGKHNMPVSEDKANYFGSQIQKELMK